MLWRGATLALAWRGVNVIRGDLRENCHFFSPFFVGVELMSFLMVRGGNASFFLFEEAGQSYGLMRGLLQGESKMTEPIRGEEKIKIQAIGSGLGVCVCEVCVACHRTVRPLN